MSSSRYLFVVKDSTSKSFSKSDDKERRLIQRHVQVGTIRRRQSATGSTSHSLPVIQVHPGTRKGAHGRSGHGEPTGAPREQSLRGCLPYPAPPGDLGQEGGVHTIPRVPTGTDHVIDPFASTVVQIDWQSHTLFQYFVNVSHPRTWHSESRSLPDQTYTFKSDALTLVRDSLHSEVHFYTMLASMASQLRNFEQDAQFSDSASRLTQNAIAAIRRYIKTSPKIDQRFIFDVHQMAVVDFYRFELESSLIHLRAVQHLVAEFGGWQNIDPSLKEWIVIGDGYVAAELLQKPVFPASIFDPGRIDSLSEASTSKNMAETGFLEDKYCDIFSAQMREILLDLSECHDTMQHHVGPTGDSGQASSMSTLHWLLLRVAAIRHRLLSLDAENDVSDAIRISLIMWLFLVMTVTGRRRTVKVLVAKLQNVLHRTRPEAWLGYEDALLWLLLLGAMCIEGGGRGWFLTQIRDQTRTRSLPPNTSFDEDDVVTFLKEFFYLDKVQRPILRAVVLQLRHSSS